MNVISDMCIPTYSKHMLLTQLCTLCALTLNTSLAIIYHIVTDKYIITPFILCYSCTYLCLDVQCLNIYGLGIYIT